MNKYHNEDVSTLFEILNIFLFLFKVILVMQERFMSIHYGIRKSVQQRICHLKYHMINGVMHVAITKQSSMFLFYYL